MFYNGQVYPVSIDNVQALARMGVAIVVVEKKAGPESSKEAARDYGVALVDTQGRFTGYTMDLIESHEDSFTLRRNTDRLRYCRDRDFKSN